MDYDTYMERQRESAEKEAEAIENARENWIWHKMKPGEEFYPFSAVHIQEAIGEASHERMLELQDCLEESKKTKAAHFEVCDLRDIGITVRAIVRDYWEGIARHVAESKINEPEDEE